jgi:hypothetical protein
MKKSALPIGIIAMALGLFLWIACQKNDSPAILDQATAANQTGVPGPSPADTVSPNPIYNITDSCGVSCVAGSCSRKATFDARYCRLVCKCGGVLGAYPQCDLICNFPTTPPGSDTATIEGQRSRTINYVLEATPEQLKVQADLVAKMKTSRLKHADKIAHELQEIYLLFKNNNGKLTGAHAEKYAYHLAKSAAWYNEK